MEQMKSDPKAICQNCSRIISIKKDSEFYRTLLKRYTLPSPPSQTDITSYFETPLETYPPILPFWEICKICREHVSCMYDTAMLVDGMASISLDETFFNDDFTIERRWNMSKEEIREKAELLRKPLEYI